MICRNCGVLLAEGHEKCPRCGAPLTEQEQEATPGRHDGDPWKRPVRRVSSLPRELDRNSAPAGEAPARETVETAPAAQEPQAQPAQRAAQPERRSASAARSASRPASQPSAPMRREGRKPESSAASRPNRQEERPSHDGGAALPDGDEKIRMVRRHRYQAIEPEHSEYASRNWIAMLIVTFVSVALLTIAIRFFFTSVPAGQSFCARMGWDTTAEAYHRLGREYMNAGSITRAVRALEIAQTKDPEDLETLIDLGKAYTATNQLERAELAYMQAIRQWPSYPESYRYLIERMLEDNRNFDAMQCIQMAIDNTGDSYFTTLQKQLRPATPSVSVLGGSFADEFELTITAEDGATIYYTINGGSPLEEGQIYSAPIYLEEGTWRIAMTAVKDDFISNTNTQTYIVNKPTPDAPKSNLQSGTYDRVRTVSLRAGKDCVIYYTIDGTAPTVESKQYTDPIQLRVGKTNVRAIAVNSEGKVSNEMSIEYVCKGNAGTAFKESDTIDKLALNSTTQEKFISTYGQPNSTQSDGYDDLGTYTRLSYAWGSAVFLDKQNGKAPVLVELVTSSPEMKGPRSTGVGMRVEDVLSAFRDAGGEENTKGVRNLYTLNMTNTGALGILTRTGEGEYHIGYYYHMDTGAWLELSYYSENGLITRMEWMWYMSR